MFLALTSGGQPVLVNLNNVTTMEPDADGKGTKVCFNDSSKYSYYHVQECLADIIAGLGAADMAFKLKP